MKKITQVAETGGARIDFNDFRDVFNDEIWDAIEAIFSPYNTDTEGVIVSGCVVGGSGPSSYTLSAGIVYLDGEFMRVSAASGLSLPQYIKAATAVNTTRTFEDTTIKTLYITKSADLSGSIPGAGQYIAITTTTDPDGRRLGRVMGSNKMLLTKVVDIGDWDMDSTASVTVAHGLGDSYKKIRSISCVIRDNSDTDFYKLESFDPVALSQPYGGIGIANSSTISLKRTATGLFDTISFNSTGFNRGWVTIIYES